MLKTLMKTVQFAATLAILLFMLVSMYSGTIIMIKSYYDPQADFMKGFTLFSMGTLMLIASSILHLLSKTEKTMEITYDVLKSTLEEFVKREKEHFEKEKERHESKESTENQLLNTFFPTTGTIKMAKFDAEGNISPFIEKTFSSNEEFIKYRDEIISKALSGGDGLTEFLKTDEKSHKTHADLTIEELEEERIKAEKAQNFELAAALRDAIDEKRAAK